MLSFLESLYNGDLIIQEHLVPKDPQYRQMGRELSEKKEAWRKKLSSDEFAELEVLLDLQQQIQGLELTTTFTYGFRLGAAMIIEIHLEHGTSDIAKCHDE
ncbi:hypothetical protein SAMN04488542_13224 [Fontibacillus panacisegetis]|uniref:Uncharacterized protein n=1 Tax=Fontibacillus panacisegetis TaxID=670482 RepID=A0A1G7SV78_9BACL|nr:DUF6809 family protein [Fontibacillus panacisegetis]SDG26772.1 hypothetical protein SAMN04488542_13224 [Fontibacillus panacisegetis]